MTHMCSIRKMIQQIIQSLAHHRIGQCFVRRANRSKCVNLGTPTGLATTAAVSVGVVVVLGKIEPGRPIVLSGRMVQESQTRVRALNLRQGGIPPHGQNLIRIQYPRWQRSRGRGWLWKSHRATARKECRRVLLLLLLLRTTNSIERNTISAIQMEIRMILFTIIVIDSIFGCC